MLAGDAEDLDLVNSPDADDLINEMPEDQLDEAENQIFLKADMEDIMGSAAGKSPHNEALIEISGFEDNDSGDKARRFNSLAERPRGNSFLNDSGEQKK